MATSDNYWAQYEEVPGAGALKQQLPSSPESYWSKYAEPQGNNQESGDLRSPPEMGGLRDLFMKNLPQGINPREFMAKIPQGKQLTGGVLKAGQEITQPLMEYFGPAYGQQSKEYGEAINKAFGLREDPESAAYGQMPYQLAGGRVAQMAGKALSPFMQEAFRRMNPRERALNKWSKMGEEYNPQMAERAQIAGETKTPIGDVIKSRELKQLFENKLPGTEPILNELGGEIESRGRDIRGEDLGKDPNATIGDYVSDLYENEKDIKNALYKPVNELAEKEGIKFKLPTASRIAKENLRALEDSPMLKNDSEFSGQIKRLLNVANPTETRAATTTYSPVLDAQGNPIVTGQTPETTLHPSMPEAKEVAGKLYKDGQILKNNPNTRGVGDLYVRISNAIRGDIKNQIATQGSPQLQDAFHEAENNFREKFSSFLDKEVFPFTGGDKSTETIVRHIIKPGSELDKHELIDKFKEIFPKEKQHLLGDAYLQSAVDHHGNFSVGNLRKKLRALGPRQMRSLFGETKREAIKDFETFTGMNEEAYSRMFNPKTGARNTQQISNLADAWRDIQAGIFGNIGKGKIGSAIAYPASAAYRGLRNALLRRWLTDPEMREAVLSKKMQDYMKRNP